MLIASGLDKRFGGKVLFAGLDWQVGAGERIGLVGANGAGKTTLLRVLAGEDPADAGRVTLAAGARLAYLPQEAPRVDQGSVRMRAESGAAHVQALGIRLESLTEQLGQADAAGAEELAHAYDEAQQAYAQAGGYTLTGETQAVLEGLGFAADAVDRPVAELSGGWWMRVELARLLVAAPDYLLLDEPTNHLDAPAVAWLERFLAGYVGSWVVVSHDRTFLNRCARAVCELSAAQLTRYTGNYDAYVAQKAAREEQAKAQAATTARKAAHLSAYIDRFGAKASKAKQAQSRAKQLAKLTADAPPAPARGGRTMALRLKAPERSGQVVARLENASVQLGERVILGPVDWRIERGQKVVVVGPNGAGKTTLLRAVAGALPLATGARALGHNVTPYYFAQHQLDMLRPGATVLEEAQAALPNAPMGQVRALLGAFLFDDDAVARNVEALSGGEKARLALAKMLAQPANFLVLDEPTNHLDLPSREALEAALEAFAGTVLVVSHDRYFASRVATHVLEVPGNATLRPFAGNFAAYEAEAAAAAAADKAPPPRLREAAALRSAAPAASAAATPADRPRAALPKGAAPHDANGAGKASYAAGKEARRAEARRRKEIGDVEREVAACEKRVRELDAELCDPATFADAARSTALLAERANLADEKLAQLLARWERLHAEDAPA